MKSFLFLFFAESELRIMIYPNKYIQYGPLIAFLFSILFFFSAEIRAQNLPKIPVPSIPSLFQNNNKNARNHRIDSNQYAIQNSAQGYVVGQGPDHSSRKPLDNPDSRPKKKKDEDNEEESVKSFAEQYEEAGPDTVITINQKNFLSDDRVFMIANFMKGNADEETIPVIILHDANEEKKNVMPLAEAFAKKGMAVLVPDLRGCGECTRRIISDYAYGPKPVDRLVENYTIDNFTAEDYRGMINYDGKFWFFFLIDQHNKKKLNMRRLVVIGSGMGAAVASGWVKNDWAAGGSKNARFTKLLVLLSPEYKNCHRFLEALKKRSGDLFGFLTFAGELDQVRFGDAKKLQSLIGGRQAPGTPPEKRKFPIMPLKTSDQATELISESFDVADSIKKFIDLRYARPAMKNTKWSEIRFDME